MRRRTVSIGGSRQSATRADDNHDTRKKIPHYAYLVWYHQEE